MSVVAEAASVAGLVSLAGQAVQATSRLYAFIKAYKELSFETEALLKELAYLRDVLDGIAAVAEATSSANNDVTPAIRRLHGGLQRCRETIVEVEGNLKRVIEPPEGHVLRKMKVAARKDFFDRLRQTISSEKESLSVLVGTTTWSDPMLSHFRRLELITSIGIPSDRHTKP